MTKSSNWLLNIATSYPNPNLWRSYADLSKDDAFRFVRLWVFEGIPFAFSTSPAVYQLAREAFASILGDQARNVSMTGSGRIGFSLASHKFGEPFNQDLSDIDLFLVSESCFSDLRKEAELFVARFNAGLALARNPTEKSYWIENSQNLPRTLAKGFVDQKKIPNVRDRYPRTHCCYMACNKFSQTVSILNNLEKSPRVSVRIYKDWQCAEAQIGGSLLRALRETGHSLL